MGKCQCCNRDMIEAYGCDYSPIIHHGKKYRPIKVGDPGDIYYGKEKSRCGDCGAITGHYHHVGCDLERCPVCGEQLISCGCADSDNRFRPLWTDEPSAQSKLEEQASRNMMQIVLQENSNRETAEPWFRYILMKVEPFKEMYAIYQVTKVTKTYCDVTAVFISGMTPEKVSSRFPLFPYDHVVREWGKCYRLRRTHVEKLLRSQDARVWNGIKYKLIERSKILRVIEKFKDAQLHAKDLKFARICPRCGNYAMDEDPVRNAYSRYADVYICDKCGMDEAIRDWNQEPLLLSDWSCTALKE